MDKTINNLFKDITDHRIDRTKKHPLESVLYIVLCGTIAGIDSWIGYQDYGEEHYDLLCKFIDLPYGIPSHDTIARVIEGLDVEEFLDCFEAFTKTLIHKVQGIISIDGKTIRGSHDVQKDIKAKHIVSAWAENCKLVLGQEKVDEKSNEITAIPILLKRLDLQGRIVTIDAMGCQREICEQIVGQGGDYVISLKGNQGTLHADVALWFKDPKAPPDHGWEEWDKGHGRIEHRKCFATGAIQWLQETHQWPGLASIAVVHSTRETAKGMQSDTRYKFTAS